MSNLIGVLFIACLVAGFLKSAVNETVFGIHDSRFRILVSIGLHVGCCLIANGQYTVGMGSRAFDKLLGIGVALKQFDGKIACGELVT